MLELWATTFAPLRRPKLARWPQPLVVDPDLMIVDVRLRDGSGISAVEEILTAGWIPHVFVSGETSRIQALNQAQL